MSCMFNVLRAPLLNLELGRDAAVEHLRAWLLYL
jgi:hypothetical protein